MTVLNLREILAECARQREEYETLLRELVEIPSISSDPEREPDVHRAAVRAAELIGKFGGTSSILHSNTNVPFVHGSFFSSSKNIQSSRFITILMSFPLQKKRNLGKLSLLFFPNKVTGILDAVQRMIKGLP